MDILVTTARFFSDIIVLAGIFGITFVLEKKTVKVKPWTKARKWLIGDLEGKIQSVQDAQQTIKDELKSDIKKLDAKLDDLTIERYMTDITDFANDIDNGIIKDEAQIRLIIEKIDKYENQFHKNGYVLVKGNKIKEECAKGDVCEGSKKKRRKREC